MDTHDNTERATWPLIDRRKPDAVCEEMHAALERSASAWQSSNASAKKWPLRLFVTTWAAPTLQATAPRTWSRRLRQSAWAS